MSLCKVPNCTNAKYKDPDISFHKFPKYHLLRLEWANFCDLLMGNINNSSYVICSDHFDDDCFNRLTKVTKLKKNAIPSLFKNEPKPKKKVNTENWSSSDNGVPNVDSALIVDIDKATSPAPFTGGKQITQSSTDDTDKSKIETTSHTIKAPTQKLFIPGTRDPIKIHSNIVMSNEKEITKDRLAPIKNHSQQSNGKRPFEPVARCSDGRKFNEDVSTSFTKCYENFTNSSVNNSIKIRTDVYQAQPANDEVIVVTGIGGKLEFLARPESPPETNRMSKYVKRMTLKSVMTRSSVIDATARPELQVLQGKINAMKTKFKLKRLKVKLFHTRLRRLNRRIELQKPKLEDLKVVDKDLAVKVTTLPFVSTVFNDLIERQLAVQEGKDPKRYFPPEVRDFTLNVNSISSFAYQLLNEAFNNVLPHKNTLTKWRHEVNESTESSEAVTSISNQKLLEVDPFNVIEQYIGSLPNQVKYVLTENGFDQLATLLKLNEDQVEDMVQNNQDLPFGHIDTLKQLPQLIKVVSKKITGTHATTPNERNNNERERYTVILRIAVSCWLNEFAVFEKPFTPAGVVVHVNNSPYPYTGTIRCVLCLQDINTSIRRLNQCESTLGWSITGFIKHFRRFHVAHCVKPPTEEPPKRVKASKKVKGVQKPVIDEMEFDTVEDLIEEDEVDVGQMFGNDFYIMND